MNLVKELTRAKLAFPSLPVTFFEVLADCIKSEEFSDARLRDAVMHVIKTYTYSNPTIATFIGFDKTYEVFTYPQMVQKVNELGPGIWKYYQATRLPGRDKPVWINLNDILLYNLKTKEK